MHEGGGCAVSEFSEWRGRLQAETDQLAAALTEREVAELIVPALAANRALVMALMERGVDASAAISTVTAMVVGDLVKLL
jgi:hypothetical protein